MNYIDHCLDVLEKLINLCKKLKNENEALRKAVLEDQRTIADLYSKWQLEVQNRLAGK